MRVSFGALVAVTILLTACAGGSASQTGGVQTVDVALTEWEVKPAVATVKAGKVTFVAKNNGKLDHELELSNKEGLEIPAEASLEEAEDIEPGKTKSFTIDLKPGTYELACRLVEKTASPPFNHYEKGMHAKFVVQ